MTCSRLVNQEIMPIENLRCYEIEIWVKAAIQPPQTIDSLLSYQTSISVTVL